MGFIVMGCQHDTFGRLGRLFFLPIFQSIAISIFFFMISLLLLLFSLFLIFLFEK